MGATLNTPAADGEAAIRAAGDATNRRNAETEDEIRAAIPAALAAARAVKSRSESTGWQVGRYTGLNISPFQNWLYEKNREWHFTDGTICVLWCLEFPDARSDYAKNHRYVASTRRDYNMGRHQADAPRERCVPYDRFGDPLDDVGTGAGGRVGRLNAPMQGPSVQSKAPVMGPLASPAVAPSVARSPEPRAEGMTTDRHATARRLAVLESYVATEVLGPSGFKCHSYGVCRASHSGPFFEGQLHHIGKHYDVYVDGRPLRIVVVGQEYGNGPAGVTLTARYDDVAVRTGLGKRFRSTGVYKGRNPHMRGTTSLLRLLFGRDPGDRHEDEFWNTDGLRVHLFDMFALVNFLLCSAIAAGESDTGSKHGRSTPTMQTNCSRHFVRAIEILEPSLVVVQGKDVLRWMTRIARDECVHSDTLRQVRIGGQSTLLATLSHPSAQGAFNWADLSRAYLRDVVSSTALQARRLLLA